MKKLFSVILSLIFALFVISCDKATESVNNSGTFSSKTKDILVTGVSWNFQDIKSTKSQTETVSKAYHRIDNEYVLEAEVVSVPEVQTKANTKVPIGKVKCYTKYSYAGQPIKEQVLDFTNGQTAKLQVPVDDKNFKMVLFSDITTPGNYPKLTSGNTKIGTLSAKSGTNMCSKVYTSSNFTSSSVSLTLTPLFSQISVSVSPNAVGSNEAVTLNTATLKTGSQSTASVNIDVSNNGKFYDFNSNNEVKTLTTTANGGNDFIPNNQKMTLDLKLTIGTKQKQFTVSLDKVAQSGCRYLVNLTVKKSGDEHSIYLLSEHTDTGDEGTEDLYAVYKYVHETTTPENQPIKVGDTTEQGKLVKWDDTASYVDTTRNEYIIECSTGNGGWLKWVEGPTIGKKAYTINSLSTGGVFVLDETDAQPQDKDVYFTRTTKAGVYKIRIKKNASTNNKKFIIRFTF